MWHQWFNCFIHVMKLRKYFLCAKKKKKNFFQQFLLFRVRLWRTFTTVPRMCVHSSGCKQGAAHSRSTSERRLLRQQHHTHASWYSREWQWRLTQKRRNRWIKSCWFSLRSFITLRLNHWCHIDYFNDVLTAFLGVERVSCCLWRVRGSFIKNVSNCFPKMVLWVLNDMRVSN